MIVRATFSNIYSFNQEVSISFVAGKSTAHPTHIAKGEKRDDIPLLKSTVIYGANASGKSNIVKAVAQLRKIALGHSVKGFDHTFKLSKTPKGISMVELEFKVADTYYAYGVEFSAVGISEEWLYKINKRTERKIFVRKENEYEFGKIKGNAEAEQFVRFLAQGTPQDKCFLHEYASRNGRGMDAITAAHGWFEKLRIVFPNSYNREFAFRVLDDKAFYQQLIRLLPQFDTGIVGFKRIPVNKEEISVPEKIYKDIVSQLTPQGKVILNAPNPSEIYYFELDKQKNVEITQLKTTHKNEKGEECVFDVKEESDGSLRLIDFLPMLIDLSINNTVYLIDEIDRSMHPLLTQRLFDFYYKTLSAQRNTQLIATMHDVQMLDETKRVEESGKGKDKEKEGRLRADEVWLVEKNNNGASVLYSLVEYKKREDVRKGYLQGRYGAIPKFNHPITF